MLHYLFLSVPLSPLLRNYLSLFISYNLSLYDCMPLSLPSNIKQLRNQSFLEELVALDSSLDYVEYPNNVVEVEEEQLLIQVREKG